MPSGEAVESAAEYASEGGGEIIIKGGKKTLFRSSNARKKQEAPEELMPRMGETTKILGLIRYLFPRKKKNKED